MPRKLSPGGYALVAFAAIPFVVVAALFLVAFIVAVLVMYWPFLPFAVYHCAKKSEAIGEPGT